MTWEIVIVWWYTGQARGIGERFGAWPTEEVCQTFLTAEVDVAFELRPGLRGVSGACYRKDEHKGLPRR